MASGANNTFRQVGIATGIAVLGAVFQSQIVAPHLGRARQERPRAAVVLHRRRVAAQGGHVGRRGAPGSRTPIPAAAARTALLHAYHIGFSTTLNHLMDIGAIVAFVGVLCAFALVRQRDFVVRQPGAPGRGAPGAEAAPARRRRGRPPAMPEPFTLEGRFVRLEPLSEAHIPAPGRGGRRGPQQLPVDLHARRPRADDRLRARRAGEGGLGRARGVRHRAQGAGPSGADRVVGATRFCEIAFWQWPPGASHQRHGVPDVVDIGFTWLAGSAQRTPVNTEAKLLMMTHAFEVWQVHRVALQTDVRNKRSWAAIERIGGQLDGIMRADRPGSDDTVRTSARFSIVAAEWPEVKARLTARLDAGGRRRAEPSAQARARVAEILRRCSACTAASASSLGRTAATALPVRWIFQASWSARSTVWPKISTKAWITVWNVVTSSFQTMTAHRSSKSKNASMSSSARTGSSIGGGIGSRSGVMGDLAHGRRFGPEQCSPAL